jgi:hypothetical protein
MASVITMRRRRNPVFSGDKIRLVNVVGSDEVQSDSDVFVVSSDRQDHLEMVARVLSTQEDPSKPLDLTLGRLAREYPSRPGELSTVLDFEPLVSDDADADAAAAGYATSSSSAVATTTQVGSVYSLELRLSDSPIDLRIIQIPDTPEYLSRVVTPIGSASSSYDSSATVLSPDPSLPSALQEVLFSVPASLVYRSPTKRSFRSTSQSSELGSSGAEDTNVFHFDTPHIPVYTDMPEGIDRYLPPKFSEDFGKGESGVSLSFDSDDKIDSSVVLLTPPRTGPLFRSSYVSEITGPPEGPSSSSAAPSHALSGGVRPLVFVEEDSEEYDLDLDEDWAGPLDPLDVLAHIVTEESSEIISEMSPSLDVSESFINEKLDVAMERTDPKSTVASIEMSNIRKSLADYGRDHKLGKRVRIYPSGGDRGILNDVIYMDDSIWPNRPNSILALLQRIETNFMDAYEFYAQRDPGSQIESILTYKTIMTLMVVMISNRDHYAVVISSDTPTRRTAKEIRFRDLTPIDVSHIEAFRIFYSDARIVQRYLDYSRTHPLYIDVLRQIKYINDDPEEVIETLHVRRPDPENPSQPSRFTKDWVVIGNYGRMEEFEYRKMVESKGHRQMFHSLSRLHKRDDAHIVQKEFVLLALLDYDHFLFASGSASRYTTNVFPPGDLSPSLVSVHARVLAINCISHAVAAQLRGTPYYETRRPGTWRVRTHTSLKYRIQLADSFVMYWTSDPVKAFTSLPSSDWSRGFVVRGEEPYDFSAPTGGWLDNPRFVSRPRSRLDNLVVRRVMQASFLLCMETVSMLSDETRYFFESKCRRLAESNICVRMTAAWLDNSSAAFSSSIFQSVSQKWHNPIYRKVQQKNAFLQEYVEMANILISYMIVVREMQVSPTVPKLTYILTDPFQTVRLGLRDLPKDRRVRRDLLTFKKVVATCYYLKRALGRSASTSELYQLFDRFIAVYIKSLEILRKAFKVSRKAFPDPGPTSLSVFSVFSKDPTSVEMAYTIRLEKEVDLIENLRQLLEENVPQKFEENPRVLTYCAELPFFKARTLILFEKNHSARHRRRHGEILPGPQDIPHEWTLRLPGDDSADIQVMPEPRKLTTRDRPKIVSAPGPITEQEGMARMHDFFNRPPQAPPTSHLVKEEEDGVFYPSSDANVWLATSYM